MDEVTHRLRRPALLLLTGALLGCPESDPVVPPPDVPFAGEAVVPKDTADAAVPDVPQDTFVIPEVTCQKAPVATEAFPSAELGVRIVEPSGRPRFLVAGSGVVLGGRVFGNATALGWVKGEAAAATPTPIPLKGLLWQTGAIPLDVGDNVLRVIAKDAAGKTSEDRVVITAYPTAVKDVVLRAEPDTLFAAEAETIRVTLELPTSAVDATTIELQSLASDGQVEATLDKLRDDGDQTTASRCDAIAGDRVYSACVQVKRDDPKVPFCLRARMTVKGYGPILSPARCVPVVKRVRTAECKAFQAALNDARTAYEEAADHPAGLLAALASLSAYGTAGASPDQGGVWVKDDATGMLGAVPLSRDPLARGGTPATRTQTGALGAETTVGSRRALVLRLKDGADEADIAAAALSKDQCPPYNVTSRLGPSADVVESLRALSGTGVLVATGHGGVFFDQLNGEPSFRHAGAQEALFLADGFNCESLPDTASPCQKNADCKAPARCVHAGGKPVPGRCLSATQADLGARRLALAPNGLALLPSFVDHYAEAGLPSSLVSVGACSSLWNGSLAMAFMGQGARVYTGWTGPVADAVATDAGTRFVQGLATDLKAAGDAFCTTEDPLHPGSRALLAGALNLSLDAPGLQNGDFELPKLAGWTAAGDGRRESSFCGQLPTEGEGHGMAVISTGLGFTEASGSIEQRFCVPKGVNSLVFFWKYYSAELELSCGTLDYQDRFRVLATPDGKAPVELLKCTVSDVCLYDTAACLPKPCKPPSSCGCGKCYEPYSAVPASTCTFDGQPVMATGFTKKSINVSAYAGQGPITLRFEVTDGGQKTNDTAILLDAIGFE